MYRQCDSCTIIIVFTIYQGLLEHLEYFFLCKRKKRACNSMQLYIVTVLNSKSPESAFHFNTSTWCIWELNALFS